MLVIIKEPDQEASVHRDVIYTGSLPNWSDEAEVAFIKGHGELTFARTEAYRQRTAPRGGSYRTNKRLRNVDFKQ